MDNAQKWLSAGAVAAGLILSLACTLKGAATGDPFSLFFMVLVMAVAVGGALAGVGFLVKVGPRILNGFPPPVLVSLGFILGALIVAIGSIYVGLRIVAEIASAL